MLQLGIHEGLIFSVQEGVGKVADIVDHHGMVGLPGVIDGETRPGIIPQQLGNPGRLRGVRQFGVTGEYPDQSVENLDGIRAQLMLDQGLAKVVVRVIGQPAVPIEGPAVIGAAQLTVFDGAVAEFQVPMRTAVLHRAQHTILAPEHRDGLVPERDFPDLAILDGLVVFDGIPAVGIHARSPGLLPGVASLGEARRRGFLLNVCGIPHGRESPGVGFKVIGWARGRRGN